MSSVWQKTKFWLGFGTEGDLPPAGPPLEYLPEGASPVALLPDDMENMHMGGTSTGTVRPVPTLTDTGVHSEPQPQAPGSRSEWTAGGSVRPLPAATGKPSVISPASFDDAKDVGDCMRFKQAVIMNLQSCDRDLARRLIDFASGLCYGVGGRMERVAEQVYLLTPSDVEISQEERRWMTKGGYED